MDTIFTIHIKTALCFSLNYITGEGINSFRMPVEGGYTRIITRTFGRVHLLNAIANWNNSFWNDRIYLNASLQGTFNRSYGHFQEYNVDVSNFSYNASLDWQVQLSQRYGWKLDGNIKYRSKKVLAQEHSDDWYTVSLGLTKQFKNGISAYINGNNLINKDHSRSFWKQKHTISIHGVKLTSDLYLLEFLFHLDARRSQGQVNTQIAVLL